MKNKLISMTLILAAVLISVPAGRGGNFSYFNTNWNIACTPGAVTFSLTLSTRKAYLITVPTSCSSPGSGEAVPTSVAPTRWTMDFPDCYDSLGNPKASISGNKFGKSFVYSCWGPGGALVGPVIASGYYAVSVPVGVK